MLVPYNDLDSVTQCFQAHGDNIAALIIEPIAGNMGCVLPKPDYLAGLRSLCDQYGVLLIFDEVMTGFRVAPGGAQVRYQVQPDLTTLGKIIGGGLPVGAVGGRRSLMEHLAPIGQVYQAGTLSGGPLTVAAGLATLEQLTCPSFYDQLEQQRQRLTQGIERLGKKYDIPVFTTGSAGMFGLFFSASPVHNFTQATACNQAHFAHFQKSLWQQGIYWPPSPYEAAFLSSTHSNEIIDQTLSAIEHAFKTLMITC